MQDEQNRLDDVLSSSVKGADPILVASLKRDQRRRYRRMLVSVGVLLLLITVAAYAWHGAGDRRMVNALVDESRPYRNPNPPTAAQAVEVQRALLAFRATLISYKLGFDAVFPNQTPAGNVAARLGDYPGEKSWPDVLGYAQVDPQAYSVIDGEHTSAAPFVAVTSALRGELASHENASVLCFDGVTASGSVVASGYASLYCRGDVAGSVFNGSYATMVVDGNFGGRLTANSYFAAAISGNFTGRIVLGNYAIVYIDKDFDGSGEIKASTLVIGGRATRAALSRITGPGTVYVGESDLSVGKNKVGDLDVIVKGAAATAPVR